MIKITEKSWQADVIEAPCFVFVLFYSPHSAYSRRELEKFTVFENDHVFISAVVDVDLAPALAVRELIVAIPTLLIIDPTNSTRKYYVGEGCTKRCRNAMAKQGLLGLD